MRDEGTNLVYQSPPTSVNLASCSFPFRSEITGCDAQARKNREHHANPKNPEQRASDDVSQVVRAEREARPVDCEHPHKEHGAETDLCKSGQRRHQNDQQPASEKYDRGAGVPARIRVSRLVINETGVGSSAVKENLDQFDNALRHDLRYKHTGTHP